LTRRAFKEKLHRIRRAILQSMAKTSFKGSTYQCFLEAGKIPKLPKMDSDKLLSTPHISRVMRRICAVFLCWLSKNCQLIGNFSPIARLTWYTFLRSRHSLGCACVRLQLSYKTSTNYQLITHVQIFTFSKISVPFPENLGKIKQREQYKNYKVHSWRKKLTQKRWIRVKRKHKNCYVTLQHLEM